jgi:alpha-1,3-glucosyltransferase
MFPFGRGLCHAYWAPNFWVFYIIMDKLLAFLLVKLGFSIQTPKASFTGGLVGDSSPFAVLPTVTPLITFIMVLLALSPCLVKTWRNPNKSMITRFVAYAYTCGFMFGWHVHEKAALHFVVPLAVMAAQSIEDSKHYFLLSIVSCYSLFPLLFEAQEYPIKVLLLLLHVSLTWFGFSSFSSNDFGPTKTDKGGPKQNSKYQGFCIGWFAKIYLVGLLAVEFWGQILHPYLFGNKLPFLPLMMISIYCALGMFYSWIWQWRFIVNAN